MNKINSLFANSTDQKLLSLYFCAGSPTLEGTADVILTLQRRGIAMIPWPTAPSSRVLPRRL